MNDRIRILHLPNTLSKSSGIMSVIMNYYRYVDKEKIQFDFLCFKVDENNYFDEIDRLGGKVFYINTSFKKMYQEIERFLKVNSQNYDIVEYHAISIWGLFLPLFRKYGIANEIIHAHNSKYADELMKSTRNFFLNKYTMMFCNHHFACSKKAATFLFGKRKNVQVINNAVDLEKFKYNARIRDSKRTELAVDGKIVIGHVGRLSLQKNHDFLLDMFNELYKHNKKYHLILIGAGELYERLNEKVHGCDLMECVSFFGQRNDVHELMQAMDFFVLPSLYEGLPVVGIEAQAADLPCFFSDKITKEVGVLNASFLCIDKGVKGWCDLINNKGNVERHIVLDEMTKRGYNITKECVKLTKLYEDMVER